MKTETETFFGRILQVELECPNCATLYVINETSPSGYFNQRSGVFKCSRKDGCGKRFLLGVYAWTAKRIGPKIGVKDFTPADRVPSWEQSREIRRITGQGIWNKQRLFNKKAKINAIVVDVCICAEKPMKCPVHNHLDIIDFLEDE
jgi:hypothetical protein